MSNDPSGKMTDLALASELPELDLTSRSYRWCGTDLHVTSLFIHHHVRKQELNVLRLQTIEYHRRDTYDRLPAQVL